MRRGIRLAFDVGQARVGVARCDADAILAVPVVTLRRDRYGGDLDQAADLVEDCQALEVIVGLPRRMSGGASATTKDARRWAQRLAALINPVPVRLIDERLTTVSAERALHESGMRAKQFRGVVDQAAAVVILELALESERSTGTPPGEAVPPAQRGRQ